MACYMMALRIPSYTTWGSDVPMERPIGDLRLEAVKPLGVPELARPQSIPLPSHHEMPQKLPGV